jgi:small subunit ribosomal protein S8
MLSDPIADFLTRIRNAGRARRVRVAVPESRLRREIARVLQETGYIESYSSDGDPKKPTLTVELRYHEGRRAGLPMIGAIDRISKPGRRVYLRCDQIPRVRNGLGIAIVSTPKGVMTDAQAREARVGGEYLARVW